MRANIQKMISRVSAFLLLLSLIGSGPGIASAAFEASDSESSMMDILTERENAVAAEGGSYSYTAPTEGEFLIENTVGTLSITNGTPVIGFGTYVVTIPAFDYYKVVNQDGMVRFYQADVSKDPECTNNFVYIGLYEEDMQPVLHVQYASETESKLYNIMILLTEEQFLYFSGVSTEFCLGDDEVSGRLKTSARAYKKGSFDIDEINDMTFGANALGGGNSASIMALNPIADYTYDSYTNFDGIINTYVSDGFGDCYLEDGYTITDDPIVEIIPKELCFILGEHIYVGKEYGFFLRVVQDNIDVRHYAVDVIVFDIINVLPTSWNDTGTVRVEPVFKYTYRAAPAGTMSDMDPTLSGVVFPHVQYDYVELFLYEVGVKISIENPAGLNQSDSGYDAYEDEGSFITQTRLNVRGVGLKKKGRSFVKDVAVFVFGFGRVSGPITVIGGFVEGLYHGFGNNDYWDDRSEDIVDNEVNINTLRTNSTDQITHYGDLIKAQSVELNADEESPRLIHVGGGYVEVKYVVARKSGSTYFDMRVITSVSVRVVEDNTRLTATNNEVGEMVIFDRGTGTYERVNYKNLNDISLNGYATTVIPANWLMNVIKVTPKVSGSYKLITSGNNGDPQFRITNVTKGTTAVVATNDISTNNRNATLTLNLIGGDVYYIDASCHVAVEPYEYTLRMGYNPTATQAMTAGTSYTVTTVKDSYQMIRVTPTSSAPYRIYTNKTSGDPQIFLFSAAGVLLGSDDDSGGNLNASLSYTMYAGTTYYIAVQGYNGNATSLTLTVGY